jgi:hypothetical protein
MTSTVTPGRADLAGVLFTSTLQESEAPTVAQIRRAIEQGLRAWYEDCAACAGCVAQEAGDHPDEFVGRMHWALAMVHSVYENDPG